MTFKSFPNLKSILSKSILLLVCLSTGNFSCLERLLAKIIDSSTSKSVVSRRWPKVYRSFLGNDGR